MSGNCLIHLRKGRYFLLGIKRDEVRLVPHRKSGPLCLRKRRPQILGSNVIDILHIGSTAIKDIAAKPIIDVAVIISQLDAINIEGMERHGYVFSGEACICRLGVLCKIPGRGYIDAPHPQL
jgi:GrpB-like predicted nucleotidyltransferase (UPF0157 family)